MRGGAFLNGKEGWVDLRNQISAVNSCNNISMLNKLKEHLIEFFHLLEIEDIDIFYRRYTLSINIDKIHKNMEPSVKLPSK